MATTPNFSLRYPLSSDPVDVSNDLYKLATDSDTNLNLMFLKAGGTLTGDVTLSKASPTFSIASSTGHLSTRLKAESGFAAEIYFTNNANQSRWVVGKSQTAESGSNAGSDFTLLRYSDAGSSLGTALTITRSSGKTTLGSVGSGAGLELGTSGPRMMSGTGSPESVVTAPIGSIWYQTDSTVGVTHWRKAIGAGNTGWVVLGGDTGWRKIVSWTAGVQDGTNQLGTIDTAQYGITGNGGVYIRRIGDYVDWWIKGAMTKTNSGNHRLFTVDNLIPPGFRADGAGTYGISTPVNRQADFLGTYGIGDTPAFNTAGAGVVISYYSWRHFTVNPWPSSLPGVVGT